MLSTIINDVKAKRGIQDSISSYAIRKKVERKSLVNCHLPGGQVSQRIEPIIVSIIVQMTRMRQCLTPSEGMLLVNSLISGIIIQQE